MKRYLLKPLAIVIFGACSPAFAQAPPWQLLPVQNATSGDVVAATATATLAAPTNGQWLITSLQASGNAATAGTTVSCTVTGLQGGTMTLDINVSTLTTLVSPAFLWFNPPLAAVPTTAVVFSCPSFGAGNPHASLNIQAVRMP